MPIRMFGAGKRATTGNPKTLSAAIYILFFIDLRPADLGMATARHTA
jgi:hypothetical protein